MGINNHSVEQQHGRRRVLSILTALACLAATSSCELPDTDAGETAQETAVQPTQVQAATVVVTNQTQPGFGGSYIAGNRADAGSEIYIANWNGCDVRCIAADYNDDGYFMSDIIDQTQALELSGEVATGRNFISPRTGLHYKFIGFREQYSGSDLITENPHRVVNRGTFRCYWNPVEGL